MTSVSIAALIVFAAVLGGVGGYRSMAAKRAWFDVPNQRSSHITPTPGGAGIVFALVLLPVQWAYSQFFAFSTEVNMLAVLGLGLLLAVVGWLDDRFSLPSLWRALVFLIAALGLSSTLLLPLVPAVLIATVAVFAYINFFNFMDGIDGIAASECAFIALGLMLLGSYDATVLLWAALIFAACSGFLFWNWAPAKVFMGDAGSLFCGFYLAALAIFAHSSEVVHISVSLMLSILFVAEPLAVLLLRAVARENITQAHRSHVYQLLAARWGGHQRVTISYLLVNFVLVLPLAVYIHANSAKSTTITVFAYVLACIIVAILRHRLLLSGPDKI